MGWGLGEYSIQISQYTRELEAEVQAGNCYDAPMTVADVDDYLDRILLLFRDRDEAAVRLAARSAFATAAGDNTAGFQRVALPVLNAIDAELNAAPYCPADGLEFYYQASCPQ